MSQRNASNETEHLPWLVMVYLAGDNNLSDEMVFALQELLTAGAPGDDVIVAQFDPSGLGIAAQRYDSTRVTSAGPHKLEAFRDPDFETAETDTGAPGTLEAFIRWANRRWNTERPKQLQHRLLILSGHGSGATEDVLMVDRAPADALTILELTNVLAKVTRAKRIDILGMDACYMNMAEVAWELRDYVDILIGSEGQAPAFGWPYARILTAARKERAKRLASMPLQERASWEAAPLPTERKELGPPLCPKDLAKLIIKTFVEDYADYDRAAGLSAELSAINLREFQGVKNAFTNFVKKLPTVSGPKTDKLLLAHYGAQTYKFDQFADMKDLCVQLKKKRIGGSAAKACDSLAGAIRDCIISSGCSGSAYQHSHGLSIYFPWALVAPEYEQFKFAKDTKWVEFLEAHVKATRRGPREHFVYSEATASKTLRNFEQTNKKRTRILGRIAKVILSGQYKKVRDTCPPKYIPIADRMNVLAKRAVSSMAADMRSKVAKRALTRWVTDRVRDTTSVVAPSVIPDADLLPEFERRFPRAIVEGGRKGRYTGDGSRYTGDGSRYTGDGSRSVTDRERSIKNLPPVIGYVIEPSRKKA